MATVGLDQASRHKSPADGLDRRIEDLKNFDAASQINSHCDDLVGQITLAIESTINRLKDVQTRLVDEVNGYRDELLDATAAADSSAESNSEQSDEHLKTLADEIDEFKATNSSMSAEASKKMEKLLERTSDLRRKMRAQAFGGQFLRLVENDLRESDMIGRLEKTKKDVLDDFAIRHTVLDDLASPFLDVQDLPLDTEVTAVLYLNDGSLAVGLSNGLILVWDPVSNKQLFELGKEHSSDSYPTALAQLPHGQLVSGDAEGSITVWDLGSKQLVQKIGCSDESVLWLKVLPNGHVAACCADIYIWDLSKKNDQPKRRRVEPEVKLAPGFVHIFNDSMEWNSDPNVRMLSYLSKSCELDIQNWDVSLQDDQDPEMTLQVNFELLSNGQLAFSYLRPDGVHITIWDSSSSKKFKEIKLKVKDIESCTILPSGDAVICRQGNKVEIYSLQDKKMTHSFRNKKGPILAIRQQSRNSLTFVHLKDPRLPVLVNENSQERYNYSRESSFVSSTCFSGDGKYIAVGSERAKLVIWPLKP